MNKRGWLKVLEVFMAILLLVAILTIILNNQDASNKKKSEEIYKQQAFALRIIQLDDNLRGKIMSVDSNYLPTDSDNNFPSDINNSINNAMPDYLICKSMICLFGNKCVLGSAPAKKDIYVKSVLITTDGTGYETRELKLFCWEY